MKTGTLAIFFFFFLNLPASSAERLDLPAFLEQVKAHHQGYQGSVRNSQAAKLYTGEASLMLSPAFFSNLSFSSDEAPNPIMNTAALAAMGTTYTKTNTTNLTVGINQLTSFGLSGKLSYSLTRIEMPGYLDAYNYSIGQPKLELTQSLWRNFLGRETRATVRLLRAGGEAKAYAENFKLKAILVEAEAAYWRLVFARSAFSNQEDTMKRAQKIYKWNERRVKLQLTDRSDLLQAESALKLRNLELESAKNEERTSALAFNQARGIEVDQVDETLLAFDEIAAESLLPPVRTSLRDDVKAAQQGMIAATMNADISRDKNSPTLEVFGSYALNSHEDKYPRAFDRSFSLKYPTQTIGLRFVSPLDFWTMSDARRGWALEREGSELNYHRKIFEQDREWMDLTLKLSEAKKRYDLTKSLEDAQAQKLKHEQTRLERGRSTTYQVILFEQDYAQSQFARLRSEMEILTLLSRMKLFGESP